MSKKKSEIVWDYEHTYEGFPFYKRSEESEIWWVANKRKKCGILIFSFDKKKVYYYYRDYPQKLSEKEIEIFKKYEPFWANFRQQ